MGGSRVQRADNFFQKEPGNGTSEVTDDFVPDLFVTRPTLINRETKIVHKLNMRESVQKIIEEKRSESILRGKNSSTSIKRASSRQSKLSFGGDEIRTYEKVCRLHNVALQTIF